MMARVLISMDDEFLGIVDTFAEKEHRSRSELIREALRNYMRRNQTSRTVGRAEESALLLESILED
jgi:CopG family transcriptional regulator / antitoxin EndoAI